MDFWNSDITEESWKRLVELRKEFDFVLIGGWAVYLYTRLYKSKDIDIIVDYPTLRKLSSAHRLSKNERLSKYEIREDRFDIDIYLPKYSKLSLPADAILESFSTEIEGFRLPTPEALMALKLGALSGRRESTKGKKDIIDALGLLFFSGLDLRRFKAITVRYGLKEYVRLLLTILTTADKEILTYLNLNEKTFSQLRNRYKKELTDLL